MPKIIEIGKYLFKLQLKMLECFFETHCSTQLSVTVAVTVTAAVRWEVITRERGVYVCVWQRQQFLASQRHCAYVHLLHPSSSAGRLQSSRTLWSVDMCSDMVLAFQTSISKLFHHDNDIMLSNHYVRLLSTLCLITHMWPTGIGNLGFWFGEAIVSMGDCPDSVRRQNQ